MGGLVRLYARGLPQTAQLGAEQQAQDSRFSGRILVVVRGRLAARPVPVHRRSDAVIPALGATAGGRAAQGIMEHAITVRWQHISGSILYRPPVRGLM
jgi:hypothetical protein